MVFVPAVAAPLPFAYAFLVNVISSWFARAFLAYLMISFAISFAFDVEGSCSSLSAMSVSS